MTISELIKALEEFDSSATIYLESSDGWINAPTAVISQHLTNPDETAVLICNEDGYAFRKSVAKKMEVEPPEVDQRAITKKQEVTRGA